MVDRELGPHPLKHLRPLLYSPDQHRNGLPLPIFECDDDPSEAHETFEKITRIDPAIVVLPANLFPRFGRALLQVHIVRRDRHVIEQPFEPGNENR